jgi:hypothetical protein
MLSCLSFFLSRSDFVYLLMQLHFPPCYMPAHPSDKRIGQHSSPSKFQPSLLARSKAWVELVGGLELALLLSLSPSTRYDAEHPLRHPRLSF